MADQDDKGRDKDEAPSEGGGDALRDVDKKVIVIVVVAIAVLLIAANIMTRAAVPDAFAPETDQAAGTSDSSGSVAPGDDVAAETGQGGAASSSGAADSDTDSQMAALFEHASFTKTNPGYGSLEYAATVTNTTDKDFEDVVVELDFYDLSGSRVGQAQASVDSWPSGSDATFATYSTTDAFRLEARVASYSVVGGSD